VFGPFMIYLIFGKLYFALPIAKDCSHILLQPQVTDFWSTVFHSAYRKRL
jgi:hypothetical protein